MTSVIGHATATEANLDSRALAVDLIQQGYNALMDCDVKRVMPLVREATQDMSANDLRRLIQPDVLDSRHPRRTTARRQTTCLPGRIRDPERSREMSETAAPNCLPRR
jgi:hypothetical protein